MPSPCWPARRAAGRAVRPGSPSTASASPPTPTRCSPTPLPWRQREIAFERAFPQFSDLLVAVIDADTPEQADETAADLAAALAADTSAFRLRPPARRLALPARPTGCCSWTQNRSAALMDRTIDAQPFLGQLVADPSARGLFAALNLLAMGVERGEANLEPMRPALEAFRRTLADAADGAPAAAVVAGAAGRRPASTQAGRYRFVLVQPRLDYGALEPGGAATAGDPRRRRAAPWVKAGQARVRITGSVALADEEFATVAEGAVAGHDRQPAAGDAVAGAGGADRGG